jgi:hypothetical protein
MANAICMYAGLKRFYQRQHKQRQQLAWSADMTMPAWAEQRGNDARHRPVYSHVFRRQAASVAKTDRGASTSTAPSRPGQRVSAQRAG